MARVAIHPLAERELYDASRFYETLSAGLGQSLVDEVQRGLNLLVTHPMAGTPVGTGFRRLLLRRFPYALIYQPRPELLCVLAVMHLRRRPACWAGR